MDPRWSLINRCFCSGVSRYSGYMAKKLSASMARVGKKSRGLLISRMPPKKLAMETFFTPGMEAMRAPYELGRLKMMLTLCRVMRREAPELRKFQVTAVMKVCRVQNRKMQTAIAITVLAVRIQLRRRCFSTKGANFIINP